MCSSQPSLVKEQQMEKLELQFMLQKWELSCESLERSALHDSSVFCVPALFTRVSETLILYSALEIFVCSVNLFLSWSVSLPKGWKINDENNASKSAISKQWSPAPCPPSPHTIKTSLSPLESSVPYFCFTFHLKLPSASLGKPHLLMSSLDFLLYNRYRNGNA